MRKRSTTGYGRSILLVSWGLLFLSSVKAQVFVNINANGANDGTSWANAYTDLQTALNNTANGQIWVARGSYHPSQCDPCQAADKEVSFNLPPDIQLYGGFLGNETLLSQRNWIDNPTVLSGDLGNPGDSTDNSYKVVVAENSTPNTILDGFIIEEGNADGSFGFSSGGGLYMDANPGGTADMQVRNCIFRNNYGGGGGGLAIDCVLGGSSKAIIYNCTFEGNTASLRVVSTGAAVFIQGNAGARIEPAFIRCTFQNNFCGNDGGAFSATPTGEGSLLAFKIDSCVFINNRASDRGGAIWYRMSSQGTSAVLIQNSQFFANSSGGQGGAIYTRSSFGNLANDTIVNCLFSQNIADGSSDFNDGEGGAIFIRGSQTGIKNQQIINCGFDRNFAADRGGAIVTTSFFSSAGECNLTLTNCTFSRNKTDGEGGAIHTEAPQGSSNHIFVNSIFWEDSTAVEQNEISSNGGNINAFFNNFDGGLPATVSDGGNNTSLDPHFADPANGDIHLLASSPLIDAGDNNGVLDLSETDLDGNKRIHNGIVDLGAHEIGVIYVDMDATAGLQNGRSWEHAFLRVPDAFEVAGAGDQIWVAEGTYFPIACNPCLESDKETAIRIVPNVESYGGFQANETELEQRDWAAHPTILSGDIGVMGDSTDNSYKVLVAENSTTLTILDGFIIEEGNADGSFGFSSGGGLFMDANPGGTADMQVRNCTFRNNYGGGGGGLAIDCVLGGQSKALIYNCTFERNTASLRVVSTGAAVFIQGNSGANIQPRFVKCTFQNNFCGNDGGAFSATPTGENSLLAFEVDSCSFINNRASDRGGAIWYRMSSEGESAVVIKNSEFLSNSSGGQGGAIFARSSFENVSNDTIINCIFKENISDGTSTINPGQGGAVFLRGSQQGVRTHHIINSVFERNFALEAGGGIANTSFILEPGTCIVNITNCTFYKNTTNGNGGALHMEGSQGTNQVNIRNSILWDNQSTVDRNEVFNIAAMVTLESSNLKTNIPSNIQDGGNNLNTDPQFVDAENGDLRISACSPMINAGNNLLLPADLNDIDKDNNTSEPLSLDILGAQRIFSETVDIGAYEWNGSPPVLSISIDSLTTNCHGLCEATARVEVRGGVSDYSYAWSDGQTTASAQGLCAGTYYLTVSDGANCILTDSIIIREFPLLEAKISSDTSICEGESVELMVEATGGKGPYTFDWNQGLEPVNSQIVSPIQNTTYSVIVRDSSDCRVEKTVSVGVQALPVLELQEIYRFCSGSSVTIDAGNFASYQWSTGDTTTQISIDNPGNYEISVLDENGCMTSTGFEVMETPSPEVVIQGLPFICEGQTTELSAEGFVSYLWSTGDTTAQLTVGDIGNYRLSVTDESGCQGIGEISLEESRAATPEISGNTSFCFGGQAILAASDGFVSYQWSDGSTSQQLTTNRVGTISLDVIDENGCIGRNSIEISNDASPPTLSIDTSSLVINCIQECVELSVGVQGSESYAVNWSSESGLFAAPPDALTVDVCRGDLYYVQVQDKVSACSTRDTLRVQEDKALPVIEPLENIPAFGCTTEKINLSVNVEGGIRNVSWSTDNGGNINPANGNLNVEVDAPGDYQLTVQSDNGCTASQTFMVPSEIEFPLLDAGPDLIIGCDESVQLQASSTSQGNGFSIRWTSADNHEIVNSNSLNPEVKQPGIYFLSIQNLNNGCEATDSVLVELQFPADAQAGADIGLCDDVAGLSANLPEGTEGFWTTNSSVVIVEPSSPQSELAGLLPGEQSFTWTLSAPGCPNYSSDEVIITRFDMPEARPDFLNIGAGDNRAQSVDLIQNDQLPTVGLWEISLLNEPEIGSIDALNEGKLFYSVPKGAFGETIINYRLCSLECPDQCSEGSLSISVEQEKISEIDIPNAITPNDDGLNERFVVEVLEVNPPERFPDNELIVFNRWGDIVFQQIKYDNSWNGVNQMGEPLPTGTYYYILRLDLEDGLILKGDITIIR